MMPLRRLSRRPPPDCSATAGPQAFDLHRAGQPTFARIIALSETAWRRGTRLDASRLRLGMDVLIAVHRELGMHSFSPDPLPARSGPHAARVCGFCSGPAVAERTCPGCGAPATIGGMATAIKRPNDDTGFRLLGFPVFRGEDGQMTLEEG